MNLQMIIGNFISDFDVTDWTEGKIEELEDALRLAQDRYYEAPDEEKLGEGYFLDDSLYDIALEKLRMLKPESEVASRIWEVSYGDVEISNDDRLLELYPMKSIATVKGFDTTEFRSFEKRLPDGEFSMLISYKLNGWGIRFIYKNGQFVSATSRMRYKSGVNLTRLVQNVLEKYGLLYIEKLKNVPLCEIRGELMLPNDKLDDARRYNPSIVNPLYAVNSLRGDNMPDEAQKLLDIFVYRYVEEGFEFGTKLDEYEYIQSLGFKTPDYFMAEGMTRETIEDDVEAILNEMAGLTEGYPLFTDGLVLQMADGNLYKSMGSYGLSDYGSIALKMGLWEQSFYAGVVQCVIWTRGKSKYTPVILIAEEHDTVRFRVNGVEYEGFYDLRNNCEYFEAIQLELDKYITNWDELGKRTKDGARVTRVPAYNPGVLFALNIHAGGIVNFYYGGESAVVICDEFGSLQRDYYDLTDMWT